MSSKLETAFQCFDEANSQDPNKEIFEGVEHPKELLYAKRMSAMMDRFEPEASEALKLAARSQHLCRWMIARRDYPMDRTGYLKWRTALKDFHAEKASNILQSSDYDQETIKQVQKLLRKEGFKTDPETQRLEDIICLVFLEYYLEDFSKEHAEAKIVEILQKTWKKMSEKGQKEALTLKLSDTSKTLVQKALA